MNTGRGGASKLTMADTMPPVENVTLIKDLPGGWLKIASPGYFEDMAMKIERVK